MRSSGHDDNAVFKAIVQFALANKLVHVLRGHSEASRCVLCPETSTRYDVPTAYGSVSVVAHPGPGCIGPWVHNTAMMMESGMEPLSLPCHDEACNTNWDMLRRSPLRGMFD